MTHVAAQTETSRNKATDETTPCCPVCNGPLILLSRCYRCYRCSFSLCVGCEAPSTDGASQFSA